MPSGYNRCKHPQFAGILVIRMYSGVFPENKIRVAILTSSMLSIVPS